MTRTSPGSKRCADAGTAMTQGKLRRALWICDYFPRPHDMTTGTWALESVAAIGSAGLPVAVMAPTPWIPRALAADPVLRAWSHVPPYQEIRGVPIYYPRRSEERRVGKECRARGSPSLAK